MAEHPQESRDWLPCPFCGGTDIRHDAHQGAGMGMHRGETVYSMCCYKCGATFPNRYRLELLREEWNRRATVSETPGSAADVLRRVMEKIRSESGSEDPLEPFAYDASWEALAKEADAITGEPHGR